MSQRTSQHFTSLHFTSLHFAIPNYDIFSFTSLPFITTFYHVHFPSLVYISLTLVLKIRFLPWEVPIAPSGSLFHSVMVLFTKEYFPIPVLCFLSFWYFLAPFIPGQNIIYFIELPLLFQHFHDTSRQRYTSVIPEAVIQFKCS